MYITSDGDSADACPLPDNCTLSVRLQASLLKASSTVRNCFHLLALLVKMDTKSSARMCWALLLIGVLLTSVFSQTTSYRNDDTTDGARRTADTHKKESVVTHTARLHQFIRSRPTAVEKVAPVVELASGEISVVQVLADIQVNLLRVDDAQQTMTTSVSCTISWQDSSLQWNSSHYGGVGMIELDWHSVWTPLIRVINCLDPDTSVVRSDLVNVYSNGLVTATTLFRPETTCNMNHDMFPYDVQQCPLAIVPMSYFVNLKTAFNVLDPDLSSTIQNPDWELVKLVNTSLRMNSNLDPFPIAQVELRRLTTFYTVCLVVPMVLTSYINTLVFLVPLQSGEKVSFIVSIFVSTSVFTSFFSTIMPRGLDSVPATMKLFVGVVLESLVILVATLFVLYRFYAQSDTNTSAPTLRDLSPQSETEAVKETSFDTEEPQQPDAKQTSVGPCSTGVAKVSPLINNYCRQESNRSGTFFTGISKCVFCMSAQRLDRILFGVFFVANTVFLSLLYIT